MKVVESVVGLPVLLVICALPLVLCCEEKEACISDVISSWWNATKDYLSCVSPSESGWQYANFTIRVCVDGSLNSSASNNSSLGATFIFRRNVPNPSCSNETNYDCGSGQLSKHFTTTTHYSTTPVSTTKHEVYTTTTTTTATTTTTTTTTSPVMTTTIKGPLQESLKLEEESKTSYVSNVEDQYHKIIVKYGNGSVFGTSEEPVYTSDNSHTSVKKIQIENATNTRIVIIDRNLNLSPDSSTIDSVVDSTSTIKIMKGLFGGKLLAISAFKDISTMKASVSKAEFDIDISNGNTKSLLNGTNKSGAFRRRFVQELKLSCAFSNFESWEETGCEMVGQNPGEKLSCSCNHATVFAVLMSAAVVEVPTGVKVISYITEMLSIIFLVITVVLLMKVRNRVRGDRVKVQICVSFSLLILHVLNVFHDAAIENRTICEIFAVLTHYFLLCSAMWMLMEGITLLFKTMNEVMRFLSGKNAKKFAIFRYVVSFTVPGIIVLVSAAVGFGSDSVSYMPINPEYQYDKTASEYLHCWISNDMLLGTVVIPIAIIMFCSMGIVMRMFYVVFRMSSESENFKPTNLRRQSSNAEIVDLDHIKAALKATLVLLPVLGVPWFLGFFTGVENGGAREAFMYLNAIINGLQGVFLFFVYCIIGKEVRMAVLKSYARKRYALSSHMEISSKRRMTTDQTTSTAGQHTVSTNIGEPYTESVTQGNKAPGDESVMETGNL